MTEAQSMPAPIGRRRGRRFLLGLGVSRRELAQARGAAYQRPLATMRAYLSAMHGAAGRRRLPIRFLGALGPRMVAQASFDICVVRVDGSSEAPCSSGPRRDEPDEIRTAEEGLPGPGVELRIGDHDELLRRGPNLFQGYVDPDDNDGAMLDGWFRTGGEAEVIDGTEARLPVTSTGNVQRRTLTDDLDVVWRAPRLTSERSYR